MNEGEILPMARRFAGPGYILRFIEYMDVGNSNGWRMDDVVPARDIAALLRDEFALDPVEPNYRGEVARRYRRRDGGGEIGIIASVTQPFCRGCTRARVSADGRFYSCLFSAPGHDLRALVRSGMSDAAVAGAIASIWRAREDRYSELRSEATFLGAKPEMSVIGG